MAGARDREVEVRRIEGGSTLVGDHTLRIAVERMLTLDVDGVGEFRFLCSPGQERELAAGFALTEGLLESAEGVDLLWQCREEPDIVRLRLAGPPPAGRTGRRQVAASSCGICGGEEALAAVFDRLRPVGRTLRVHAGWLQEAQAALRGAQELHRATRGTHAALLLDGSGRVVAAAEDLGRHNALDKAIGARLLSGEPLAGLGAALSGRVSLEMAAKCVRAGVEVIAAVSAPSSLAVEVGERYGVTVACFVRDGNATVYTHPERIEDDRR